MYRRLLASSLVLLGAGAHTPAEAGKPPSLKEWPETEIRFLLLDEEKAAWKGLRTDAERQAFVDRFWAVRDPDSSTPANEFRDEVARRLEAANRLFRAEGRAGWLTDRGRIYLTFGPPAEVVEDAAGAVAETGSLATGINREVTGGIITWTYHQIPDWEAPPNAEFVFRSNSSGAYRLTREPPVDWKRRLPAGGGAAAAPAPAPAPAAGPARPVPAGAGGGGKPARALLLAALRGESPADLAVTASALTFPVGQKEALVVVLFNSAAESAAGAGLEILAAAFGTGEEPVHAASMTAGAAADPPRPRSFAFLLAPGSYRLALVGREPGAAAALGGTALPVTVPAYADGALRLSSLVLARGVEVREASSVKLDQVVDGIVIGNLAVDPAPGGRFPRGATAELFYMLSGASAAPAGAIDATAAITIKKGIEAKSRFPAQPVAGAVNDQSLPLAGLDPGEYRVEVEVTDRIAGTKVSDGVALVVE